MKKRNQILLLVFLIVSMFSCQNKTNIQPVENVILLRNYCTEIGRIDLIFYEDEVSGAYALLPKKSLGQFGGN